MINICKDLGTGPEYRKSHMSAWCGSCCEVYSLAGGSWLLQLQKEAF